MYLKALLRRLNFLLITQCGINPRIMFRSLLGLPRYVSDFCRFRVKYVGRLEFLPCLHDRYEEGGITKNEYFWQDLLVARRIFEAKPEKHVDVGSRVDGFVAHVASFREIEVFDLRKITATIPGVIFKQADLMKLNKEMAGYCDSLSCLHALEHFGLGRYGDSIDTRGFERGLVNMASLLKSDGVLYVSVPIGIDRVEFNAHRVFDPQVIVNLAVYNSLRLSALTVVQEGGLVSVLVPDEKLLADLALQRYSLGIFTFVKIS